MTEPQRISDHAIDPESIDANAIDVIETLHDHGFEAYLVGGCVRDLLCNMIPKDFDVATNATPDEVKELFRRSRMVARRFPIAHARYGRDIIEVSTFRQGEHDHLETNDQGLIVRDHAYGDMADDAFRRDFTINALYFDVQSGEIIDYIGGMEDVRQRRVRFIGDPEERLAEDPVRYLRAIRFSAKLGFDIDPRIQACVEDTAEWLEAIPSARLFDEFQKLFLSGYGAATWEILRHTPLVRSLFPSCNPDSTLVVAAMQSTDRRIAEQLPVTPGFLIAVLLWEDYQARSADQNPDNKPAATFEIAMDVLAVQQQHIAVPRRFSIFAREVWQLQNRLEERHPRFVRRLLGHRRFRAAFDFLCLRGEEDDRLKNLGRWWEKIQEVDKDEQQQMINALGKSGNKRRRRRRGRNQAMPPSSFDPNPQKY